MQSEFSGVYPLRFLETVPVVRVFQELVNNAETDVDRLEDGIQADKWQELLKQVGECPTSHWVALFGVLADMHNISGLRILSVEAVAALFKLVDKTVEQVQQGSLEIPQEWTKAHVDAVLGRTKHEWERCGVDLSARREYSCIDGNISGGGDFACLHE